MNLPIGWEVGRCKNRAIYREDTTSWFPTKSCTDIDWPINGECYCSCGPVPRWRSWRHRWLSTRNGKIIKWIHIFFYSNNLFDMDHVSFFQCKSYFGTQKCVTRGTRLLGDISFVWDSDLDSDSSTLLIIYKTT